MTEMQKVLLEIIYQISNVPGVFDHGDSIVYGLRNYVARHSLASDSYYVSKAALALFEDHGLRLPLRRGKLRKLKKHFTYEHPVPLSLVVQQIKTSNRTREEIARFLEVADCVTLLTKDEDRRIAKMHKSKMPDGWIYGTGPQFARYELYGIELCPDKIPVTGALLR